MAVGRFRDDRVVRTCARIETATSMRMRRLRSSASAGRVREQATRAQFGSRTDSSQDARPVRNRLTLILAICLAIPGSGCSLIGPDYTRPEAPTAADWLDADAGGVLRRDAADLTSWWKVFNDPILDQLVETAYRENPTLQSAGARVLESLARRGIAIGNLYPQQQDGFGSYGSYELSENRANQGAGDVKFADWQVGFDAFWELDIWGKLRRGIEAEDAELLASVADYDDVLVSLIAEVVANYVTLRTTEEQLAVARDNVAIQARSFDIADQKYQGGAVSALDSLQAKSLLEDTRSIIPRLEASIRQTRNTLCFLLGMEPRDLSDLLGAGAIPSAPSTLAVGIPADVIRRRPDVRFAERSLAAQSARIGIAKSDYLPSFSLTGTISFAAEDFSDLFEGDSFEGFGGPSFRWAILNYGRIANNVRVQDARYQSLISTYEEAVLRAQAEAENAIAGFLGSGLEVAHLAESVDAAERAVDIAVYQYREGAADYTRVLNTQQFLVTEQDRWVSTRGRVALSLTALYKALGGGWERRVGENFVSDETVEEMRDRTWWSNMLKTKKEQAEIEAVDPALESERSWWSRMIQWLPRW
jgi:NodT family efflux transporter outer membrane factor (OMF) lipoprotein